jgi:hypothetical protein
MEWNDLVSWNCLRVFAVMSLSLRQGQGSTVGSSFPFEMPPLAGAKQCSAPIHFLTSLQRIYCKDPEMTS